MTANTEAGKDVIIDNFDINSRTIIIRELECIADLTRFDASTGEDFNWLPKEAEELCLACDETCALLMGKTESSISINRLIEIFETKTKGFEESISERAKFMAENGIEHESVQDLEIGNLRGLKGAIKFLREEYVKPQKENDVIER